MRLFHPLLLLALCVSLFCAAAPEAENKAVRNVPKTWFHNVNTPVHLSLKHGDILCKVALASLRKGEWVDTGFEGVPFDTEPRGIFLSWSDGVKTAGVAFGTGQGLEPALRAALAHAKDQQCDGANVRWFKLDVVQDSRAVKGFTARQTPLPAPSLLGISFSPGSGFAFLPEQLVSWKMTDDRKRLCINTVGDELVKNERWQELGWWAGITSYRGKQKVCMFETQSFFHDGAETVALFRGHRLHDDVSRKSMLDAARRTGDRILAHCDEKDACRPDIIGWIGPAAGAPAPADDAGMALALAKLAQATGEKRYLKTARKMVENMLDELKQVDEDGDIACIQERSRPTDRISLPRPVALLETNGLAILALLELSADKPQRYDRELRAMARYLVGQQELGGSFVCKRTLPEGKAQPFDSLTANAIAVTALFGLYERFARPTFLRQALAGTENLKRHVKRARNRKTTPQDPWVAGAFDVAFTFTRDKEMATNAGRMAIAAISLRDRGTLFTDSFGAVANSPFCNEPAGRARLIALCAKLAYDTRRKEAAEDLLGEAKASVICQMQGLVTEPEAMYLRTPQACLGLFRTQLRTYSFELRSQYLQILSLLDVCDALGKLGYGTFPLNPDHERSLAKSRRTMERFPRYIGAVASSFDGEQDAARGIQTGQSLPTATPQNTRTTPNPAGFPAIRAVPKRRR
ncbi:MAG: hypothetical protein KAI66_00210 [Lentisphaeria bacterium]|nr:hypothetical protein [Lentisphaeria bacterium]